MAITPHLVLVSSDGEYKVESDSELDTFTR